MSAPAVGCCAKNTWPHPRLANNATDLSVFCNLNGKLIPLGELPRRVNELDSSVEMVVHCRSGKRSADAIHFLQTAGFKKLWNLKGGVLAWADESIRGCRSTKEMRASLFP